MKTVPFERNDFNINIVSIPLLCSMHEL